jgi:hypothetical protein
MENAYGIVMGVILLFPWSIVGMMLAGAVLGRLRNGGRLRIPVRSDTRLAECRQDNSSPRV